MRYSDLIICTANFWVENTRLYKYSNYRNDFYIMDVPMIYFNKDSSKFIAVLTTKSYKDSTAYQYYANPTDSFTYGYQMMISIRDSSRFLIYPLKIQLGYGETSWENAALSAMKFLEYDMANRSIFANNTVKKMVKLRYNILEEGFWELSPLFQKGLQMDGYFYFQNYDNSSNKNPTIIELPDNPCISNF